MALNLSKDNTFSPSTTISSSEVNTNFDELYNAFTGLENTTMSLAKLKVDGDPATALEVATKQYVDVHANYKRPFLSYQSATQVDVSANTTTTNQTKVVFPDGNVRSVTEDTASTNKYRRFDITATAEFTSGTEDSGLRSGLTEAVNTWYAIYAVKSNINTSNFVLVGDTTLPFIGANITTLNGRYNANGWVYLGLIRNGDNDTATGDILSFVQSSDGVTIFRNTVTGNTAHNLQGVLLASTASAATLAYTNVSGTGAAQIPGVIDRIHYEVARANGATNINIRDIGASRRLLQLTLSSGPFSGSVMAAGGEGIDVAWTTAVAADITIYAYHDNVLGGGATSVL